ncbi:MAG: serine hydroxymethyltransferase, partial [Planctomycetota bacterium]
MARDPITDSIYELIGASDPEVASIFRDESERQEHTIELIASENHISAS